MAVYNRGLPSPNGSDTMSTSSNAPVATQELGTIIVESFATVMKTLEESDSRNDDLVVSITRGINESSIGRNTQTEASRIAEGINDSIVKDLLEDTRTSDKLDEINNNVEKILEVMSDDAQSGASENSNTSSDKSSTISSAVRKSLKDLLTEDDNTSRIIGSKKTTPFNNENTVEGQKNIIIEEQKKKEEKEKRAENEKKLEKDERAKKDARDIITIRQNSEHRAFLKDFGISMQKKFDKLNEMTFTQFIVGAAKTATIVAGIGLILPKITESIANFVSSFPVQGMIDFGAKVVTNIELLPEKISLGIKQIFTPENIKKGFSLVINGARTLISKIGGVLANSSDKMFRTIGSGILGATSDEAIKNTMTDYGGPGGEMSIAEANRLTDLYAWESVNRFGGSNLDVLGSMNAFTQKRKNRKETKASIQENFNALTANSMRYHNWDTLLGLAQNDSERNALENIVRLGLEAEGNKRSFNSLRDDEKLALFEETFSKYQYLMQQQGGMYKSGTDTYNDIRVNAAMNSAGVETPEDYLEAQKDILDKKEEDLFKKNQENFTLGFIKASPFISSDWNFVDTVKVNQLLQSPEIQQKNTDIYKKWGDTSHEQWNNSLDVIGQFMFNFVGLKSTSLGS